VVARKRLAQPLTALPVGTGVGVVASRRIDLPSTVGVDPWSNQSDPFSCCLGFPDPARCLGKGPPPGAGGGVQVR